MQRNDKPVHNCHTRLWWHFLLLCSFVFPLEHTVLIINMKPLSEKRKKPFLYQTEGQHLACIMSEVVKMWIRGKNNKRQQLHAATMIIMLIIL